MLLVIRYHSGSLSQYSIAKYSVWFCLQLHTRFLKISDNQWIHTCESNIFNSVFFFFFPVLWGVVNNSGIAIFGEVEWLSVGMYQEVLDVNLLGMIRVTKQFLPLLRESKGLFGKEKRSCGGRERGPRFRTKSIKQRG